MKIDFVKETAINGAVTYFTEINGKFQSGSLSSVESEARKNFEAIKKQQVSKKVILASFEVSTEKE